MKHRLSLFLLLLPAFLPAQTGVFWYDDTTSTLPNNRIIAIREASDGIYLLGKAADRAYGNVHPYWAVCEKNGKLRTQKTIASENDVYEVNNFVVCEENKIRIWGTETVNGRQTLLVNTIDKAGNLPGSDAVLTNTNTLCGDVLQLDNENAVFAKTVQSSSTGKFHISLYKYNLQTDAQLWYKKLDAEENEEASKLFVMKDGSLVLLAKVYDDQLTTFHTVIYRLTADGERMWRRTVKAYENFYSQGIAEGKNKSLLYTCSFNAEREMTGPTKLVTIDSSGEIVSTKEFTDIRANGILQLRNGNYLLYGSRYQQHGNYIITKACYQLLDAKLTKIKSDELGMMDAPDANLPSLAMTAWPTASDFLTAIQLSDGRIACAGRVYLPDEKNPDKILLSERSNKALLVLMKENGEFR